MSASASSAATTVTSGRTERSREPSAMPIVLPTPAAPTTSPSSSSVRSSQPGNGWSRRRNAMYIVRKPESSRSPALLRRPTTTTRGMRASALSRVRSSPWAESTLGGRRIARIVAPTNTANA
jgi:hypothetical protein